MMSRSKHVGAGLTALVVAGGIVSASSAHDSRSSLPTSGVTARKSATSTNGLRGNVIVQVATTRGTRHVPTGKVFVTFRLRHPLSGGGAVPYPGHVSIAGLGTSVIYRADFSRDGKACYDAATFRKRLKQSGSRHARVTLSGIAGMQTTTRSVVVRTMRSPYAATRHLGCGSKHL